MHWINWVIVIGWISYIVTDGLRRARGTTGIEGYFLANRSLPWWVVGLSVMATQLSAVTMIGTTGQGATDGMRFVQFYFGLPIAMVILGVTLVPFLHGAKVYTAYEYLERRFDAKTRSLTALLFLLSRGMSCGAILSAPGIVFSAIFGWPVVWTVALIGIPTVIYTMFGGVKAIQYVDVKQMVLIVLALVMIVITLLVNIPVTPDAALHIAGTAGRMQIFDFSFDVTKQYTFWSGIIGGTFLMLSYFGTDQSQVQRYLTARSVEEARSSLLMSAYWKIPLQGLVLLIGVLVFVFYIFKPAPLLFNPTHAHQVQAARPEAYAALEQQYREGFDARRAAAESMASSRDDAIAQRVFLAADSTMLAARTKALSIADTLSGGQSKDVNYVIPNFVLYQLPLGMAGIFIAAVMAAAMNAIAAELNSLSTATVIDFYRRWVRADGSDAHFLTVGKLATLFWGLFACVVAVFAGSLGSLIEVVNRFGSFFYGSILGVFLLAMIQRSKAVGAFWGLIAGMTAVGLISFSAPQVAFLWLNVVGAVVVVVVGVTLSAFGRDPVSR
jgi:SSS family transporter